MSLDTIHLSNPQRVVVSQLLTAQRNKFKKLLHEAHERMHIIGDLTTNLEFWYNIDGHFEHISPSCEKMTGYKREDFLKDPATLDRLIHRDSMRRFILDRKTALEGNSGEDVQYKLVTKDGRVRWALASWKPVLTRRGRHIGVRVSITDISEQKAYQDFLSGCEQLFQQLITSPEQIPTFGLTPEGRVVRWSDAAAAVTNCSEKEALRMDFASILELLDGNENPVHDIIAGALTGFHSSTVHIRSEAGKNRRGRLILKALYDGTDRVIEIACVLLVENK